VPLLVALSGWQGRPGPLPGLPASRALLLGFISGLVYFVGTVYWTGTVLATFGGLSTPLALVAMLLLAGALAMFPALASAAVARVVSVAGGAGLFLMPAAWVATEQMRGWVLWGFPWVPLGNSQVGVLAIAQSASLGGVYGLSALVVLVNVSIALALLGPGRARVRVLVPTGALLVGLTAWGAWRVGDGTLGREGAPLTVGLVQPNVAQDEKQDPSQARRNFTTNVAMTRDLVRRGAELVLWPESAVPFIFERDADGTASLRTLSREVRVPVLFGSEQVVGDGEDMRLYNAAFLVGPDGETAAVYRKIHLVPFGEFFPMQEWLTMASPVVSRFLPFSPGESMVLLPVGDRLVSTAICYEVVYPSLARQAVLEGSELLTTITNDAWFGRSSAAAQHFDMAAMRAIEQGRFLVRAANTGISGVVDPYGRVLQRSGLFEQAGIVEEVRLLTGRTVYAVVGDVVVYAGMAVTVLSLVLVRPRRRTLSRA
jgi:apolipoprotein N-acyltransferase